MSEAPVSTTSSRLGFALLVFVLFVGGAAGGVAWSRRMSATRGESAVPAPAPAAPAPNREELALQLETAKELRALREELADLRSDKDRPAPSHQPVRSAAAERHAPATPEDTQGPATLAYWNQLNSVMAREAAMRAAPPKLTAGNALSFVSGESDAYTYAGGAIRALDAANVDPQALALAQEIAAWYDQGVVNSRQAGSLLQSNDVAARQGQAGKSWKSGAEEHRKQCLEINKRGERLRGELSRKYGLKFPKLL